MKKIDTAMILAAGYGTRLKPFTDMTSKALVEYKGKPMIENVIGKLESAGIKNIVINTHHHHEKMLDYFENRKSSSNIQLIYEEEILGTGGAIKNAEKYLSSSDDFIIYNTDVDCDIDLDELENFHLKKKAAVTLVVQNRKTSRYLLIDSDGLLLGRTENGNNAIYSCIDNRLFEKKAFCGIHLINNLIFNYIKPEIYVDIIPIYIHILKQGLTINTFDISGMYWKDLGIPENL